MKVNLIIPLFTKLILITQKNLPVLVRIIGHIFCYSQLIKKNYVNGKIKLEEAENAPYHRQGDMAESKSIMKMIKYIKNHDEFMQRTGGDYRRMPQDTRKQKFYYRAAKKRMERRGARRLNQLFALIESGPSER